MSVRITTRFAPLRMVLKRREPLELKVIIANLDERARHMTVKTLLNNELSFDKSGLKGSAVERLEAVQPHAEKTIYYHIFPKINTSPGRKLIKVQVLEHGNTFADINKENNQTLEITVEE
ncbi:MAG: hypothetical protein Q7S92_04060 [Candidatus Diapherotrites archaeon]|nr:hypothetical protein [Candidatus Diapherotrites archaeon]